MAAGKNIYRILVVGANDKICDFISDLLPRNSYEPLIRADNAGAARRLVLDEKVDIAIVNAPLREEFGTQLALDLADENIGVLLLTGSEVYDQICYKVEDEGVFCLSKPMSRQSFYSAIKLLTAMRGKLVKLDRRNQVLQEKMLDIRTVNRAKWLLIERHHMTENDAHRYIEKQAMDMRMSRREVAEGIIRAYDN